MKHRRFFSSLLAIFMPALLCNTIAAQTAQHSVIITSPFANEEYCNSTSLPISVIVTNRDSIPRTLEVKVLIKNIVTNINAYGHTVYLQDVPAGASIDTMLPPYVTNPYILSELGSFVVCASVIALDSQGDPIPHWALADTSCVRIFGIRTTSLPFNEPSDGYAKTSTGDIPDMTKWVSLGATVVDGDSETWDPPPPRYTKYPWGGVGPDTLYSPVIRLDRSDANGNVYSGSGVGDTLISFPFNLKGQTKAALTFDFMRGGKHFYPALLDPQTMPGPEQTILTSNGEVIRPGDSLILEFKDTSEPACNPSLWNTIAAIDGGRDFEFHKYYVRLDQFTTPTFNYFTNAFRFRLRLKANNNAIGSLPSDDDDPWYIDNISLQVPRLPEIEVRWTRVVTPYTKIPFSALSKLPVYCKVSNLSADVAIQFPMKVFIINSIGDTVYSQFVGINSLRGGADSVVRAPDWNAQMTDISKNPFMVIAKVGSSSYDDYTQNNETYSLFYLNCDESPHAIQEFALDDGRNDIPSLNGVKGGGIGFQNTSGSYAMKFTLTQPDTIFGARIYFASGNLGSDDIRISLFTGDSNSCIPGSQILAINTLPRFGNSFDTFQIYRFANPVAVPAGIYWLSVSQLSFNNFTMGAGLARGGGEMIVADDSNPKISPIYSSPYGTQSLPDHNNGDVSCSFAVESPAGSANWQQWMPAEGWWASNAFGNAHQAVVWNPQLTAPFTRSGTYLPMIRVMVGSNPVAGVHASTRQKEFTLRIENDQILISIPGSSGEVRIVDLLGRIMEEKEIAPDGSAIFSIKGLPQILFIEVRSGDQFKVFKIVR